MMDPTAAHPTTDSVPTAARGWTPLEVALELLDGPALEPWDRDDVEDLTDPWDGEQRRN